MARRIADQILESALCEIYAYPCYTVFDWLVLKSQDEHLRVSGKVTAPFKKHEVGNFLAAIERDVVIRNDIEVLPALRFDDKLRITVARFIYGDPCFISYARRPLPPIHIVIENGNVTLYGVVGSMVERIQAGDDARLAENVFTLTNNLQVGDSGFESAIELAIFGTVTN